MNNTDEYRASVLSALGIEEDVNIGYFADFRKALLMGLGVRFTEADVRNVEKFRMKVLETVRDIGGLDINAVSGPIALLEGAVPNKPLKVLRVRLQYNANGWNGANITVCGKNLIDEANCVIYPRYLREIAIDNVTWAEASDSASVSIKCKPNTQYTISINNPDRVFLRASWVDYDPATVQSGQAPQAYGFINKNPYADITITTGATAKYLIIQSGKALLTSRNSQIQIEEGSAATEYEAYNSNTYTTNFESETIYGGVFDVLNATLKSTFASDGTKLNTPVIIQLPGSQVKTIKTLLGCTNVWADIGNVMAIYLIE